MLPVLFIGHGSPMNAIANNPYTQTLARIGQEIPKPSAILCISAHWMTEGTWITHMQNPRTIHDFYGFPQALFDIQFPAPGSPMIAELVQKTVRSYDIQLDDELWGFDHGTWSVLRHMYPQNNVPVLQLSINITKPFEFHFELGKELRALREQNILIVGSGNIVHNLRKISWDTHAEPYDWAIEFDEWSKQQILSRNASSLVEHALDAKSGQLSIPTTDHYIPFLYALGASTEKDAIRFEYEGIENASISMRSVRFG